MAIESYAKVLPEYLVEYLNFSFEGDELLLEKQWVEFVGLSF